MNALEVARKYFDEVVEFEWIDKFRFLIQSNKGFHLCKVNIYPLGFTISWELEVLWEC